MSILAIDPGTTESAWIVIDENYRPIHFDKTPNEILLDFIYVNDWIHADRVAIELIRSYGMTVGVHVFDTCVWIGRFYEALASRRNRSPLLTPRKPVAIHHCLRATADDAQIAQALKDRFAPGVRNHGKGTKAAPGWFHGFHSDIWQAYALAVYTADQLREAGAA